MVPQQDGEGIITRRQERHKPAHRTAEARVIAGSSRIEQPRTCTEADGEQQFAPFADALMEKPLNLRLLMGTIRNLLAETGADRARSGSDRRIKTIFLNHQTEIFSKEKYP